MLAEMEATTTRLGLKQVRVPAVKPDAQTGSRKKWCPVRYARIVEQSLLSL